MWPHKKPTTANDFDPLNLPRKMLKIAGILMFLGAILLVTQYLNIFFRWF